MMTCQLVFCFFFLQQNLFFRMQQQSNRHIDYAVQITYSKCVDLYPAFCKKKKIPWIYIKLTKNEYMHLWTFL